MVESSDIKDEDSLRDWLKTRPRKDALLIAHRSALRALPLWGQAMDTDWARRYESSALPLLRCGLVSLILAKMPVTELKGNDASNAAEEAAFAAREAAYSNEARAAYSAAAAAMGDAVGAVEEATEVYAADSDNANAAHAYSLHWEEIRWDARILAEKADFGALWHGEIPPYFTVADNKMQALWQADPPARWDFWHRWWAAAKAGKPLNPQLQLAIVEEIDDDTWNDPDKVAQKIAEIEERFTPDAPLAPHSAEQAFARNTRAVHAQVQGLIVFVEQEHLALCGLNDVPHTLQASLEARKELLEQIKSLLEEMVAALEGDISTGRGDALQVVQQNLPAVVEKSTELAKVEPDPEVSVYITSISSTIEHMTKRGTPGHIAYFTAVGDHVFKATKDWVKKHRRD